MVPTCSVCSHPLDLHEAFGCRTCASEEAAGKRSVAGMCRRNNSAHTETDPVDPSTPEQSEDQRWLLSLRRWYGSMFFISCAVTATAVLFLWLDAPNRPGLRWAGMAVLALLMIWMLVELVRGLRADHRAFKSNNRTRKD